MHVKAIIFDWGETLVGYKTDPNGIVSPDAEKILNYCKSKGYRMAVVSLTKHLERRKKQFVESSLRKYFEVTLAAQITPEQVSDPKLNYKDGLYDQVIKHFGHFGLPRSEILIIDDRIMRGIKYANKHGHPSVWLQKGKFEDELPNEETGQPTYTIHELKDLLHVL